MLEVENLVVRQQNFCLRANFSIRKGEKVAIIGPSGSGKSTLLSTISGFKSPYTGKIQLDKINLIGMKPNKIPCTLLFQDNNLFPHLTVFQNVALGINPTLKLSSNEHLTVKNSIKKVGLLSKINKKPSMLSGGQNSRVALARTLIRDKPLLMLDEPFGALGPAKKIEMLDFVKDFIKKSNTTLLVVTHEPSDAMYIADKVMFISEGVVNEPVLTETFFKNPSLQVQKYLGKKYYDLV